MTSIGADCVPLVGDLGVPVACMSWVIDPGSDEGKCIPTHRNVGLILTLQSLLGGSGEAITFRHGSFAKEAPNFVEINPLSIQCAF